MENEIKGIFHMEPESEIFTKALEHADVNKPISIGAKVSFEWEEDKITQTITDKNGNLIGSIIFDNTNFQNNIDHVLPPSKEELNTQKEMNDPDTIADLQEETESHKPVKEEIETYHK